MKLPLSWLCDYVDVHETPRQLADRLTFAGFEVEDIETRGGGFDGVVAAEIIAVEPHPNADRLKVCRVFDGDMERSIVCGADNMQAGDKAPLATEGVRLPNGMLIRKSRLRGVVSDGMLCAPDELGLSDAHDGLLILPPATRPGTPLADVLGPPETVLTIDVTPNRGDCLSIIGMAREVAALYRVPLRRPQPECPVTTPPVSDRLQVEVSAPDGCPRYTARMISGCKVEPSPAWMQQRLSLCGVRPINNIVDITNYVMLECGQPLHAFDLTRLQGRRVVVRRAGPDETLAMLDEARRTLDSSMLVIADDREAVAIAGVMGGEASGISETTSDVVLESACFTASDIRRTARRLGVSTEASYRFERGVDPELAEWAGCRAAALLCELSGGQCAQGVLDVAQPLPAAAPVRMRPERIRSVMGCSLPDAYICAMLEALEFQIEPGADGTTYDVTAPSFRMDVAIEADLIEEVARLHGLDKIPTPTPFARLVPEADDNAVRHAIRCRNRLAGMGLREIVNYSFVSHRFLDRFMPDSTDERVVIPYPVSADHAVMRPSMLPQMVETLGRNHARQVVETALFETGRVFRRTSQGDYVETDCLAIGLMGPVGRSPMDKQRPVTAQEMFLWLKGIAENLVAVQRPLEATATSGAGIDAVLELTPLTDPIFESGQAVTIHHQGTRLGRMGIVANAIAAEWRFSEPIAVLQMAMAPLLPPAGWLSPQLLAVPAFPSVRRDLALIVSRDVSHREVIEVITEVAPPELTSVALFDIFSGRGIEPGMKSLAYAFTYRAADRTLTDDEVNRMHLVIREAVCQTLRATVRE